MTAKTIAFAAAAAASLMISCASTPSRRADGAPAPAARAEHPEACELSRPPAVPVVIIDGIAYCPDGAGELYIWRSQAAAGFAARFEADFRAALDSYFACIASHGGASAFDAEEHQAALAGIALQLDRFGDMLRLLDWRAAQKLEYIAVEPERAGEALRRGSFGDFFPPALPAVEIDGLYFSAPAIAALRQKMADVSAAEWEAMRSCLSGIICRQFDRRIANRSAFSRWYFSFANDALVRPIMQIAGRWADHAAGMFNEIINDGVNEREHLQATVLFKQRSEALFCGAIRILHVLAASAIADSDLKALSAGSMSMEELLEPYALTEKILEAAEVFGLDTESWRTRHGRLADALYIGGLGASVAYAAAVAAIAKPPLVIGMAVAGVALASWRMAAFPFTVGNRRSGLDEQIRDFLSSERDRLLEDISSISAGAP